MSNSGADAPKLVIQFEVERETKGTIRFHEFFKAGDEPYMRTIYVRKPGMEELGYPSRIKVTIEPDDDSPYPRL